MCISYLPPVETVLVTVEGRGVNERRMERGLEAKKWEEKISLSATDCPAVLAFWMVTFFIIVSMIDLPPFQSQFLHPCYDFSIPFGTTWLKLPC